MMRERFARGSVARLYLDIFDAGAGVLGKTPSCAIQRVTDSKWFDGASATWGTTPVDNLMLPLDAAGLPGRYYFDFDQSKEDDPASQGYIARLTNDDPVVAEYRDLIFGPIPNVVPPGLCAIQGTIYTPNGDPRPNVLVRATIQPVFKDALGRVVESDRVMATYTDDRGDFELKLVRGVIARLEIATVGYDRRIAVPDQESVLFTAL